MILFAMAISLGIHGIQHAYEEMYYDFNPLEGKILPKDMLTKKKINNHFFHHRMNYISLL